MPDTPSFVVNDRRKFTLDGEARPDSTPSASTAEPATEPSEIDRKGPQLVSGDGADAMSSSHELTDRPEADALGALDRSGAGDEPESFPDDETLPPGPTEEQSAEAARAYFATVDRLDTALRAADPGGERMPEMSFERLAQSLYTQALLLLGGGTQPGEAPRIDILGARQTIDMLAIIAEKTKGNLAPDEEKLLESALFDLRMGFLEITQALARQAAQRQPGAPGVGQIPGTGPRIVR